MTINPKNVIKLMEKEFSSRPSSVIKESERELATQLIGILKMSLVSNVRFEEETELIFDDPGCADLDPTSFCVDVADGCLEEMEAEVASEELQASSSNSWKETPPSAHPNRRDDIPFSKRKRAVEYWKSAKKDRRDLASVKKSYRFVESIHQLEYWNTQLAKNGLYHEQMRCVAEAVRNRFAVARDERKTIHDEDIRRWALLEARKQGVNFKASKSWLKRFKSSIKVRSRKITKFVSRRIVEQEKDLAQSVEVFLECARKKIQDFSPEEIFNTDQSGFNLEMHSGRTLAYVGDKHVHAIAQSVAATSHSYTIMPTLSAAGKLLSPLVIVTKEPEGKFGKIVEHTMFRAPNILPIAANSSMMGKKEIKTWFEDAFLPNTDKKILLFVDSLNSYSAVKGVLPKGKMLKIETIPPNTTGKLQPLDVFFFRQWKNFCRKISEFVLIEDVDFSLRNRNNIYKLQSLVHNQFSAPCFKTFRQYSWYKAGYFEGESPAFINPVDFCFKTEEMVCCTPDCDNAKLLKCAWCQQVLCIQHVLFDGHFHDVN